MPFEYDRAGVNIKYVLLIPILVSSIGLDAFPHISSIQFRFRRRKAVERPALGGPALHRAKTVSPSPLTSAAHVPCVLVEKARAMTNPFTSPLQICEGLVNTIDREWIRRAVGSSGGPQARRSTVNAVNVAVNFRVLCVIVRSSILHRDLNLPAITKYMKNTSERFFSIAESHPNPLLSVAASYEAPSSSHFIRRPRNIITNPPDNFTTVFERLREIHKQNGK
ncbi:hypothetical protein EVAR_67691_1 [Eumeta japonica]|uniref:Uncharacterized protein n=1 Tax=Eumeta variegata TaxID=151549 RepID=A0A4C1ZKL4_EUMVA|nr:hypothetical protein EVAR_67691_1 [Eumeta japonica]